MPDLQKVCQLKEADFDDHKRLGMCDIHLARWDEAIVACAQSVELVLKTDRATRLVCEVLEAFICADRPDEPGEFLHAVEKKGWALPSEGSPGAKYLAYYHGLQAIALITSGKDESQAERMMRQAIAKPAFKTRDWTWSELDKWLKTTKLAPGRKAAVKGIIADLRRPRDPEPREKGMQSFRAGRYADALPDLKKVCDSGEAGIDEYDDLGQCYGKLGRWDEAIAAYTRGIELNLKSDRAYGVICDLLEGLICADRPEQLRPFIESIKTKGWELPKAGAAGEKYTVLFHGFCSIASIMIGEDASQSTQAMRQITGKPNFKVTSWIWDDLNNWLKKTKLAPDRKAAVEKIIAELQGTKTQ